MLAGTCRDHELSTLTVGYAAANCSTMIIRPPHRGTEAARDHRRARYLSIGRGCWYIEQPAAVGKLIAAMAVGREPVIADAMEAGGQDVHQKAADELAGGKRATP